MDSLLYFLLVDTKVGGGTSAPAAASGSTQAASGGLFGGSPLVMILLYCAAIFVVMYFISIRPQKKRETTLKEMRESVKVDDTVLIASGMYGKVTDVTAECFIIEFGTNRGVRIPVLKDQVYAIKEPNLSNKEVEAVEAPKEKKGLFGFGKKKDNE